MCVEGKVVGASACAVHPSHTLLNCPFDDVHLPFFSCCSFFYYFSFSIRLSHMELYVAQIMDKISHSHSHSHRIYSALASLSFMWHMCEGICVLATHCFLHSFALRYISSAWTITMMWLFLYHLSVDSFLLNFFYGRRWWWCHHFTFYSVFFFVEIVCHSERDVYVGFCER